MVNFRRVGADALLLEVDAPYDWYAALDDARTRGDLRCGEIVPGARTVLLIGVDPAAARAVIGGLSPGGGVPGAEHARVDIPVRWDGPDLAEVGAAWGRDPVAVMRGTEFTVAFCGFAPGFAYLTGLPDELHLPRRATPRSAVPAGSLAIAGPYAGIYPRATPGGWHLLGTTEAVLFDPDREPPALFTPGMTVRMIDA